MRSLGILSSETDSQKIIGKPVDMNLYNFDLYCDVVKYSCSSGDLTHSSRHVFKIPDSSSDAVCIEQTTVKISNKSFITFVVMTVSIETGHEMGILRERKLDENDRLDESVIGYQGQVVVKFYLNKCITRKQKSRYMLRVANMCSSGDLTSFFPPKTICVSSAKSYKVSIFVRGTVV